MKQFLLIAIFYIASLHVYSQVQFYKKLSTGSVEAGHSIVKGFHRNYFVAGVVAKGGEDFFVANFDLHGNLIWANDYSTYYTEQGEGVFLENTYDGGILMGGHRANKAAAVVVKINKNGWIEYSNNSSFGQDLSTATSAKVLEDGSSIVAGYSNLIDQELSGQQFVMKLDSMGEAVWIKTANFDFWGYYCLDVSLENKDILTAGFCTDNLSKNIYLSRSDSVGDIDWTYRYQGSGKDQLNRIVPDFGCGYIGVGTSTDISGNSDILFVRFSHNGNVLTSKIIGGAQNDVGSHIIKAYDGNYIIGGTSGSFSGDQSQSLFLMKVDTVGNVIWTKSYGDSFGQTSVENTGMFVQEADSGFIMTGMDSKQLTGKDMLLMKTDENGNLNCFSISASANAISYTLNKVAVQLQLNHLSLSNSVTSSSLNKVNSTFAYENVCSSIPANSCGLEPNFSFSQNCGSNKVFFYDRTHGTTPNYSISLSFGDGHSTSGDQNTGFFTHEYSTSGFYNVNLTISYGSCSLPISKTVYVFNPLGNFVRERFFCTGDSLDLSLHPNQFTEYTWKDENYNILSNSNELIVSPGDTTTYYITAVDLRNCCTVNDSVLVVPKPPQKMHLADDTLLCAGDTIELKIFGDYNSVVQWQDASKDSIFLATDTGMYHVTVSTNCGTISDTIIIEDGRQLTDVIDDTLICNSNTYTIQAFHPEIISYKWDDGSIGDSLVVDSTAMYYLTVTDSFCSYVDSSLVQLYNIKTASLPDTFYICQVGSDSIKVESPYSSFLWSNGSTKSAIEVSTEGDIWVKVSNPCSTYTLNTYVKKLQNDLDIIGDSLICDLDSLFLNSFFPNAGIQWSTGEITPSIKVTNGGQYSVVVELSSTCIIKDTSVVRFLDSPREILADTQYICTDTDFIIDADDQLNQYEYQWNTGEKTSFITTSTPGLYIVEISNDCGLITDSMMVLDNSFEEFLFDTISCDSDSLLLKVNDINTDKIRWSTGETSSSISVTQNGKYHVDLEYANCNIRDSLEVELLDSPDLDFGSDTIVCFDLLLNAAAPQADYLWQDNSKNSSFLVTESGNYSVRVSNACGTTFDDINVEIKDCKIVIPNIFTPNSDGIYDNFIVQADYGEWQLEIFNRWGILVYQSSRIDLASWDGRDFSGKKCADGVYFVKLRRIDQEKIIHSTVMLQR